MLGNATADAIVPYQNRVFSEFIEPTYTWMNQEHSLAEYQARLDETIRREQDWLAFIHNPQLIPTNPFIKIDQSSVSGAEATLAPYWQTIKSTLQNRISTASQAAAASTPINQSPAGPTSTGPVYATGGYVGESPDQFTRTAAGTASTPTYQRPAGGAYPSTAIGSQLIQQPSDFQPGSMNEIPAESGGGLMDSPLFIPAAIVIAGLLLFGGKK